jgi:hypothetical protein
MRLSQATHPKAQHGAILITSLFFMLLLIMLLASLVGMGLLNLLGETLQQATVNASLVGASALWDDRDPATGRPTLSPATAEAAARATFTNHIEAIPLLGAIAAELTQVQVDTTAQTVTLQAQGAMNLPLLASLNLSALQVGGASTARYAVHRPPLPVAQLGGGGAAGTPCASQGATRVSLPLTYPLTNRPGADLVVTTTNGAGYRLLACSGTTCRDIGGAATPLATGGGVTVVRQAPASVSNSSPINVLYGSVALDLGATGALYNQGVNKATSLLIVDDGVPDHWQAGQRVLDLCPTTGVALGEVMILHQAHLCVANNGACVAPTGLGTWAGLP